MNTFKNGIIYLAIIIIGIFLCNKFGLYLPISMSSVVTNKDSLFTATGEGKATVIPDEAQVTLGMQTQSNSIEEGQQQVNTTINNMLSSLQRFGIEKEDIKTQNYSINPRYDYSHSPYTINGYDLNSQLVVTIRDISKVNKIIDAASQNKLNSIGNVNFILSDSKKQQAYSDARKQAVKEAKNKAESLASAAGIHLGRVVNIQEGTNSVQPPILMRTMVATESDAKAPTQVEFGSTDITLFVTISYDTH